ncbi:MAG: nucleotidyltransferase family protein [Clostridia bacterium]|nr:nucleotidyltransferase family protein [Clostridia bacterium]
MITGIVCEYNPFHKGHLYQINQAKAMGADTIVCVMSGNFVQRGECAFFDKHLRAKAAILCGADVVIDLPTPWAMSSAETFARGSIGLLESFGIEALSFGCENDDEALLRAVAKKLNDAETGTLIKKYSADGLSYPEAVSRALTDTLGERAGQAVSSPNNTLAVEYIRHLSDNIKLLPVKRIGADHDSDTAKDSIASASLIRSSDLSDECFDYVPEKLVSLYKDAERYNISHCERAILSSLRLMDKDEFSLYVSDRSGLAMRIYDSAHKADSLESLYAMSKSRNYTHSRVRREVMNLWLKVKKTYSEGIPPYIRILAVSERGLSLLSKGKENTDLPIITKYAEAKNLQGKAKEIYQAECRNTDLFSLCADKIKECGVDEVSSIKIVR